MGGGFLQVHNCWKLKVCVLLQPFFHFILSLGGWSLSQPAGSPPGPSSSGGCEMWEQRMMSCGQGKQDAPIKTLHFLHKCTSPCSFCMFSWLHHERKGRRGKPKCSNRKQMKPERKKETETGHKGPVKKRTKHKTRWKWDTHKVQAGTVWLKGKKEKRHQPQPLTRWHHIWELCFLQLHCVTDEKETLKAQDLEMGGVSHPHRHTKPTFCLFLQQQSWVCHMKGGSPSLQLWHHSAHCCVKVTLTGTICTVRAPQCQKGAGPLRFL